MQKDLQKDKIIGGELLPFRIILEITSQIEISLFLMRFEIEEVKKIEEDEKKKYYEYVDDFWEQQEYYMGSKYRMKDLFGYFKKDFTRKVFQVFSSFHLCGEMLYSYVVPFKKTISLRGCFGSPKTLEFFKKCRNITHVDGNFLHSPLKRIIRILNTGINNQKLINIKVELHNYGNKTIEFLNSLKNLRFLYLDILSFDKIEIEKNLFLPEIKRFYFRMGRCQYSVGKRLPTCFKFSNLRQITHLDLSNTIIINFHFRGIIENLSGLIFINMYFCSLEEAFIRIFQKKSLQFIGIRFCEFLSIKHLEKVKIHPNIHTIALNGLKNIPDEFIDQIVSLNHLKKLNLHDSRLKEKQNTIIFEDSWKKKYLLDSVTTKARNNHFKMKRALSIIRSTGEKKNE